MRNCLWLLKRSWREKMGASSICRKKRWTIVITVGVIFTDQIYVDVESVLHARPLAVFLNRQGNLSSGKMLFHFSLTSVLFSIFAILNTSGIFSRVPCIFKSFLLSFYFSFMNFTTVFSTDPAEQDFPVVQGRLRLQQWGGHYFWKLEHSTFNDRSLRLRSTSFDGWKVRLRFWTLRSTVYVRYFHP